MKVTIASFSGFCFGVKRAIGMADSLIEGKLQLEDTGNIYSFGEIIHNKQVVKKYSDSGMSPISMLAGAKKHDTVLIRAHGVAREIYSQAAEKNIKLIDATCPFVRKIHRIVERQSENGNDILVIGSAKHPEVIGIVGWCSQDVRVNVAETIDEVKISSQPVSVVIQTTFDQEKWNEMRPELKNRLENCTIFETICSATIDRQKAAAELAARSDLMVVVGDLMSSNTNKLYQLCSRYTKAVLIQNEDELELDEIDIDKIKEIGVIGGASTPDDVMERVVLKIQLRGEFK